MAVIRGLGVVFLGGCGMVLAAWLVGLTVSDRFVWSQYLSWLPSVVALPLAAVLWVIGAGLWRIGRGKRGGRGRGWGGRTLAWVCGLGLVAGVLYVTLWEMRVYRLPLPERARGPHLRITHWNITVIWRNEEVVGAVRAQAPDVAVLVNPTSHLSWEEIEAGLAEYRFVRAGTFVIASKVPLVRWGMMTLGLESLPEAVQERLERRAIHIDPGRAIFVEVDATERIGRKVVVWGLDMPSEPRLSRWVMAGAARRALEEWEGPVWLGDGTAATSRELGMTGFPEADVVVGDLNIVRGAASLSRLVPGMRNAFDEAGAGYGATWPRTGYRTPIPLVQIDQMFVKGLRVERYEVVEPGGGYHMMQVGDVVIGGGTD